MLIPCKYYPDRFRLKIRERCEQLGYTLADFSRETGYSNGSVRKWNAGHNFPKIINLKDVSMILGCTMDELLHDPADW